MNALSSLSDFELEANLKDLVSKERKLLHVILEHIKEVDSRKLYLERAYSSLYEYLTKELNYSGSAAMRRIEAARLLREVPLMKEKIQDGSLNLSQIGELVKAIKEKEKSSEVRVSAVEKAELVAVISGKTTQETQRDLAQVLDIEVRQVETKRIQQDESVRCEITLSKELSAKLKRCQEKLSHKIQVSELDHSLAGLIEVLASEFLKGDLTSKDLCNESGVDASADGKCPVLKGDHNGVRCAPASKQSKSFAENSSLRVNKTLTPKVKLEVIRRDKRCQYQDPTTGRVCGSTYFSQVDHKVPRWAGGDHAVSNLQILCAKHNRFKYQKESGIKLV